MRKNLIVVCLLCGQLLGVQGTATADDGVPALKSLNSRGDVASPGSVFVLENKRSTRLVELVETRPLNASGGLVKRLDGTIPHPLLLGHSDGLCVTLVAKAVVTEKLLDPFDCLEIVNRPVTGYAYNRDAELRIAQWRTSIGAAIYKGSRGEEKVHQIAVCTSVDLATEGLIVVTGAGDLMAATAAVKALLAPTACKVEFDRASSRLDDGVFKYEFPLAAPLVIAAAFRELALVDTTTQPRIEFKLNSTVDLELPRVDQPKLVVVVSSPPCLNCPPRYHQAKRGILRR